MARAKAEGGAAWKCPRAVNVDALTLLGELLERAPKLKNRAGPGRGKKAGAAKEPAFNAPRTLADAGISKKESS